MKFTKTEERNWICRHFDTLIQISNRESKLEYILKHPLLLSLSVIPTLTQERGKTQNAISEIDNLDNIRTAYWTQPQDYPVGHGPIEKIVEQFRDGEIQFEQAEQLVKGANCAGLLSPIYIKALMLSWIDDLELDLDFTMKSAELAVEAVIAMPLSSVSMQVMMQVAEGYIRLAHGSLMRRPNGRIFSKATKLGQWSAKVANASNREQLGSEFLHLLGTLTLDAYAGNFAPTKEYAKNIDVWIKRAEYPMPIATEGLKLAKFFLEDALANRAKGSPYGETIKALLEAIVYESFYHNRDPNVGGLKRLSLEAKKHLDENKDVSHINRINELMEIYN